MANAKDERRPAGELEAGAPAALWAADGPLTPAEVRRHTELNRDADRETVLARCVLRLSPDDGRLLRDPLESGDQ